MRLIPLMTAVLLPCAALAHDDHAHDKHDHEETRQLGAHVHGEGVLLIAVEGREVAMTLQAPGADIVGFEHAAKTDADRAALDAAKARLSEPLSLFVLPAAAGCAVSSVEVEYEVEGAAEDDHDHDHGHDHAHDDHAHDDHGAEATHAEFHADYTLACENPAAITAIDFAYFEAFEGAQKLDVSLAADAGQRAFEVTRGSASLSLAGAI